MKRKDTLEYIDGKTACHYISYRFRNKELILVLQMMADDCTDRKITEWSLSDDWASLRYARPATKEELEKEKRIKEQSNRGRIAELKRNAQELGYKLVKE